MSSFLLSLLSPVLRAMVCGNFRESICKRISLDDVDDGRFLKLVRLACGDKNLEAESIEELLDLGELAERLQMEAVRVHVEDVLLKVLNADNCVKLFEGSEVSGLERLRKESYKLLRKEFEVVSQEEGFERLSEETMANLLEEDELGDGQEEAVFEALVRWMNSIGEALRGETLLRKIRYGAMDKEYLAAHVLSALPGLEMLKELLKEASAKMSRGRLEGGWDGVERLCSKWMVARKLRNTVFGADVLTHAHCVAIDLQGRIVVSDKGLHQVIIFNRNGTVARVLGSRGAVMGQLEEPMGVAVDRRGHIVVADYGNHRVQVLDTDGSTVKCFGSRGNAVGHLEHPYGVAIDCEGNIIVADSENHRIQVFNPVDGSVVRHFGSWGTDLGKFNYPTGLAVDEAGRIVVVDYGNHRVQVFNLDGSVAFCFGSQGYGVGQLSWPSGVAVDREGRFVVTACNHRVQVFNSDGSVARVIDAKGRGVGELRYPQGVAVDGAGRIVVAEGSDTHRVQVF